MAKYNMLLALAVAATLATPAMAQESDDKVTVSGSIMSDILVPQTDKKINSEKGDDWARTNTYADVTLNSKLFEAGARFEFLEHPLPGFENDFKGWGLPHAYVKGKFNRVELTVGTFYEQFGSGFVLRSYQERSLGVDNSILGGRLVVKPVDGITVKALTGKQRRYWDLTKGWLTGADAEFGFESWIKSMREHNTSLSLGFSWLNKHEDDEEIMTDATHRLNLPRNVNSWGARLNLQKGGFGLLAEYAQKSQDPSSTNGYIYRKGYVAMLSTSYSQRGMSLLLQAKRSDNMGFRSQRSLDPASSAGYINHMPAFTMDQTYALAAMYPYATNPEGEWAYQAELGYTFKRKTLLGGKYGTNVKVNFSHVRAIDKNERDGGKQGSDGYGSAFWKWGSTVFYQDINVQIDKKFTSDFKLNLMYMNQRYNMTVIQGEGGMVKSNIFIADAKYRIAKKTTLRAEAQYLNTKQDQGDWVFGLLELSVVPHWMFTISDQWNIGETDLHYYQGFVTYSLNSHRIQAGYGRTRAGYNCSGGVCRYVPASKGFTLSYNYSF